MSGFTEIEIIEKIRETAERAFTAIGIKKNFYSEIEQKPTALSHRRGEVFMASSKSMIWNLAGCWCEYRAIIGYDTHVDVLVTVRGADGNTLRAEFDNFQIEEFDSVEFCKEMMARLKARAKTTSND